LVIVHEWNDPKLVQEIGEHHADVGGYCLLFHDTHHRSVSNQEAMAAYDLSNYDGVLAYGAVIRDIYLQQGWTKKAWVWHEAADIRRFHPIAGGVPEGDLVWIGNWGDDERTAQIHEFLIEPVRSLGLEAVVYGVRYPENAIASLADAGIEYRGWLPNYLVPSVFSRFKLTVHIPRQFYRRELPGIPTIRVFEALACGIPLISAPWQDTEGLFNLGRDYWVARDGEEMKHYLVALLENDGQREAIAKSGLNTIHSAHTCAHRVDELLAIYKEVSKS
jgi:spore maturation protein CgeB